MTPTEIKELVQTSLKKRHDEGKTIQVVGVPSLRDGQWQILVEPTEREPSPRFHYYEMLGDVEDELSVSPGVSVFLTPAPEATYTYEVENEAISVKRRETMLFVSTSPWQGFWSVYSLGGERLGEVIVGEQTTGQNALTEWEHRFDYAVRRYMEEQSLRSEREHAITTYRS